VNVVGRGVVIRVAAATRTKTLVPILTALAVAAAACVAPPPVPPDPAPVPASMHTQAELALLLEAAARYMLEKEGILDLDHLVVDIGQYGIRPESLSDEMRRAAAELAVSLGAGTGRLQALMVCPKEPPAPEVFRRRGHHSCNLEGGVRSVIQVDTPQQIEEGLMVPVALWVFVDDRAGDQSWIRSVSHQLRLTQESTGEWRVLGHGITSRARF
jgi:hypothetical protein